MFCARKIWVILAVINIAGVVLLRHYDVFYRTIPIQNFETLEYYYPPHSPKKIKAFSMRPPQSIMQDVMNSVSKGENCNGMSELFLHTLRAQGYKARKLFVVKSIGDQYATHTLVEVFEKNKWVIYDPTFNVSFKKDGQLLGAVDISRSLLDGSSKQIKPIFYGSVAYPARLETYPIHWLAHFNNVLMFKYGNYSSFWFIRNTLQLVTRYWRGPVLYYFSPIGKPNDYLELINWFYFFFACILPLLLLVLTGLILSLIVKESPRYRLR